MFLSQRVEEPRLALVTATLPPRFSTVVGRPPPPLGRRARHLRPDHAEPHHPPRGARRFALSVRRVWEWTGDGGDEGDDAAAWFTEYLGRPARLARVARRRRTSPGRRRRPRPGNRRRRSRLRRAGASAAGRRGRRRVPDAARSPPRPRPERESPHRRAARASDRRRSARRRSVTSASSAFGGCAVGASAAGELVAALPRAAALRSVDLSANGLKDEGAWAVAWAFDALPATLGELDLSSNCIEDDGALSRL